MGNDEAISLFHPKTHTDVLITASALVGRRLLKPAVADIKYSQVVAKMIAHQNNFPGAKFELWADAGGNTAALRNGVLDAIREFFDKKAVNAAMRQNLIDNFEVFNHPIRYRR